MTTVAIEIAGSRAEPTPAELFARARALAPYLAEQAEEGNRLGRVPEAVVARMKDAGLFRVLQPRRWGGYEMSPEVFYDIQMILGEGDMSAAWVYGIVGVHSWHLALFDDRAAQEVWGDDQDVLIASTYMPVGKLTAAEGGYRLTGRWGFSSGSDNCDWALLGAMLPDDASGEVRQCTLLVPKSDYRIVEDSWQTIGLKGTGSKDVIVEDAFVPAHRVHHHMQGFRCDSPGNAVNTADVYRLPFGQVFIRAINSAAVGAAQGMLDAVIDYAKSKKGPYQSPTLNVTAQHTVARAATEIADMKNTMRANFRDMLDYAGRGEDIPMEKRLRYKLQATQAASRSAELATALFRVVGGNGLQQSRPFGRMMADLLGGRQHQFNQEPTYATNYGAYLMGLGASDYFC
jgi:3-hydroxy-9,10-secoandrosta-1,3,5(10)-triene-9,17-dione monooxygenase